MLIGKYKNSVDSKNRIFVPHKFREDLGVRCVLSQDLEYRCLNLYSTEKWNEYCERIEQLPSIEMEEMRFLIYSNSNEVEIDSQGRIVLNQLLCEDWDMLSEKEVMIVGIFSHIQIWKVSDWEEMNQKLNTPENRKAVKNQLKKFSF